MMITEERVSLKHLLTVESLSNQEVLGLIQRAQQFKHGDRFKPWHRPMMVANLFFENSTRTHKASAMALAPPIFPTKFITPPMART